MNPGFDPARSAVGSIDLAKQRYDEEKGKVFYRQLLQKLRAVPGVSSAALARTDPVQRSGMRISTNEDITADFNIISPDFFQSLGVSVLRGHDFRESDAEGTGLVAIVNETLGRRITPNGDVVGKMIADVGPGSMSALVIGVVPDMRYRNLREPAESMLYVPLTQFYMPGMTIIVRSQISPEAAARQIPAAVAELNKDLPVYNSMTLEQKLSTSLVEEQIVASLLSIFGLLALLLAGTGLYSLLSYLAQTRMREIGVRMAVGANRRDVLMTIVFNGLVLSMFGIFTGLILSLSVSRLLQSRLYGVSVFDL